MTIQCAAPDPALGVALRLAGYLDCQARALGENGFQTLAGGPVLSAILSALVAIFIALIGYRMVLGTLPSLRDGIGWAIRLGMVLALMTSWPAFQTLVYNVATDGPEELAAILLPAAGLPSASVDERIQSAYDVIRLGAPTGGVARRDANGQVPAAVGIAPVAGPGLAPLPQTASLLVVSTMGFTAALRLAVGFLIAIGPLGILCLLFDGTLGIFNGWVRALVGAALGVLATSVTNAFELMMVESEIMHAQAVQVGSDVVGSLDPQALVTIILVFAVVALALVGVALRTAGAFRLPRTSAQHSLGAQSWQAGSILLSIPATPGAPYAAPSLPARPATRTRAGAVADALTVAAYREQAIVGGSGVTDTYTRRMTIAATDREAANIPLTPVGAAARRSTMRRTRVAGRRDATR